MNRIDQEYRKRFKQQSFPDSLKKKGWAGARKMLDAEMPVKASKSSKYLKYGGTLALALLTGLAIWYFTNNENTSGPDSGTENISNHDPAENLPINPQEDPIVQEESNIPNSLDKPSRNTEKSPVNTKSHESLKEQTVEEIKNTESGNEAGEAVVITSDSEIEVRNDITSETNIAVEEVTESENAPESIGNPALVEESSVVEEGSQTKAQIDEVDNNSVPQKPEAVVANEMPEQDQQKTEEPVQSIPVDQPIANEVQEPATNTEPVQKDLVPPQETEEDAVEDAVTEKTKETSETAAPNSINYQHLAFEGLDASVPSISEKVDFHLFSRERFSLSMWMNYAYTGKILSATNDEYLQKRRAEEKAVWTPATGFSLDYFLEGNRTIGIGISFSEYGEQISYSGAQVLDTSYIDGRYNSPSEFPTATRIDSVRIIDSINVGHWNYTIYHSRENDSVVKANGRSSWRYIEIPITYGFRLGSGPVRWWLRPGVSVGVPIRTDFHYLSHQHASYLQDNTQTTDYIAPVQFNAIFNVGVDIYLNRRWSLRLNGIGSMQLNSALREEGVSQRYYRLGGGIEIGYNF